MSLSAPIVCKVNYAVFVKEIMPPSWGKRRSSRVCVCGNNVIVRYYLLAAGSRIGIDERLCVDHNYIYIQTAEATSSWPKNPTPIARLWPFANRAL